MDDGKLVIWEEIVQERDRQDQKFGKTSHSPEWWLVVLVEEIGEVSEAIIEKDRENYEIELIQVAAVAVAALESVRKVKNEEDS